VRSGPPEFNTYHCQASHFCGQVIRPSASGAGSGHGFAIGRTSRVPLEDGDVVIAGRIPLHSAYRRMIKMRLTKKLIKLTSCGAVKISNCQRIARLYWSRRANSSNARISRSFDGGSADGPEPGARRERQVCSIKRRHFPSSCSAVAQSRERAASRSIGASRGPVQGCSALPGR
jgi:hypothetical protein